jgi:hypothetical protein
VFKVADEPVKVRRDEVKDYVEDPTFLNLLTYYNWTKLWGLPHGGGWADLPCDVLDGITAIELEARAIEAESIEASNPNSKKTTLSSSSNQDAFKRR